MDTEVKRLENKIKQACLIDKPRMARQGANDHTTELEGQRREFMTVLPWLRPHVTKRSNQGNTLHTIESAALAVTREIEDFTWTIMEGELKPHTGDATT